MGDRVHGLRGAACERRREFDVADLYVGPVDRGAGEAAEPEGERLDEKLRQGYFWIVNHAIISPYYDVEYDDGPPQSCRFGGQKLAVTLPSDQSCSSYMLLPLLNLLIAFAIASPCGGRRG